MKASIVSVKDNLPNRFLAEPRKTTFRAQTTTDMFFHLCSNGHKHSTALLLSIFLGLFGVDRFYLGYPAVGIIKLVTIGGFTVGAMIDVILIATGDCVQIGIVLILFQSLF